MDYRVVESNPRLAAERQIHAAIIHFLNGQFECAITLASAAEGRIPEPSQPNHLFARLKRHVAENPPPNGQKDDFNYDSNWLKHQNDPEQCEIHEMSVKLWLYRAVSKYCAVYGKGTPEMASVFPWASTASASVQRE